MSNPRNRIFVAAIGFALCVGLAPSSWAADEIQERGVLPLATEKAVGSKQAMPLEPVPLGNPPAQLCYQTTLMLTQCKCFSQAKCQQLTALFPGSCPAGSQHCEFVPMSRGAMPPLPPDLCRYQVPLTVTECSCSNQADCQLLSPFCPSTCPVGSQSCTCRPLLRR